MKREQLSTALLLLATAAMVYLCYQLIAPFLTAVFGAAILVIVFMPLHRQVSSFIKSPGWSALLSTVLVAAFIILPIVLIGRLVVQELTQFYDSAQAQAQTQAQTGGSKYSFLFEGVLRKVSGVVQVDPAQVERYVVEHVQQLGEFLLGRTTSLVKNVGSLLFNLILIIFTMFFLFRDRHEVLAKLEQIVPLSRSDAHDVFIKAQDLIISTIYGNGVVAVLQGSLAGLAFWVLGIPSVIVWTVVMVLLAFIPMLGTPVIWIPAVIGLLLQGHVAKGLLLLGWGAGVVGTVDNVLRPILIGRRTTLHTIVIFFAVLGGISVFGPMGIVLGPVIVVVTLTLVDILRRDLDYQNRVAPTVTAPTSDSK